MDAQALNAWTRRSVCILLLSGLPTVAYAQVESEGLEPDRPDQSEGVTVLKPKQWQIEWGVARAGEQNSYGLMLRYGLLKDWELRLEGVGVQSGIRSSLSLDGINLSSKLALFSGDAWVPAMTLVAYLNYSVGVSRNWNGDLCLAFSNDLSERLSLDYNVASTEGFQRILVTGELNYDLAAAWSCYAEYYGRYRRGTQAEHGMDFGLCYMWRRDLSLDLSLGRSWTYSGRVDYLSLGGAIRF